MQNFDPGKKVILLSMYMWNQAGGSYGLIRYSLGPKSKYMKPATLILAALSATIFINTEVYASDEIASPPIQAEVTDLEGETPTDGDDGSDVEDPTDPGEGDDAGGGGEETDAGSGNRIGVLQADQDVKISSYRNSGGSAVFVSFEAENAQVDDLKLTQRIKFSSFSIGADASFTGAEARVADAEAGSLKIDQRIIGRSWKITGGSMKAAEVQIAGNVGTGKVKQVVDIPMVRQTGGDTVFARFVMKRKGE